MKRSNYLLVLAAVLACLTLLQREHVLPDIVGTIGGPLVTICAIIWAYFRGRKPAGPRRFILLALVLSLIADIVLGDGIWFIVGLGVFLLAHLAYIVAFSLRGGWSRQLLLPLAVYSVAAAIILGYIWEGVSEGGIVLQIAVICYVACLSLMAALASSLWLAERNSATRRLYARAAVGGGLFFVSDAILAIDKFADPIAHVSVWVLGTFWLAGFMIAASLPRKGE